MGNEVGLRDAVVLLSLLPQPQEFLVLPGEQLEVGHIRQRSRCYCRRCRGRLLPLMGGAGGKLSLHDAVDVRCSSPILEESSFLRASNSRGTMLDEAPAKLNIYFLQHLFPQLSGKGRKQ